MTHPMTPKEKELYSHIVNHIEVLIIQLDKEMENLVSLITKRDTELYKKVVKFCISENAVRDLEQDMDYDIEEEEISNDILE